MLFLTLDEVMSIHADQIKRYGGSMEMRDAGLLKSALAMPEAQFGGEFLHPTPHEMASAYLFHLVQNHAFFDGNKRVGAVAARVFLLLNGFRFDPEPEDYEKLVLDVASGNLTKIEVAAFFLERMEEPENA